MVLPTIFLIAIPVILGIAYVQPFEQVEQPPQDVISEGPNWSIIYIVLTGFWIFFLVRILIQIKRRTFKVTHRY